MWDIFNLRYLLLAFLIFTPLEWIFALHSSRKLLRAGWGTDVIYAMANAVLVKFGLIAVFAIVLSFTDYVIPLEFRAWVGGQPVWIQLVAITLIADVGYYWAHRLSHQIPWLWKIHAVHHCSEELDWLAAMRNHPLDLIWNKAISLLPIFALGFSDASIGIYTAVFFWMSVFIHSNVNLPFGPLKWIVISPQFHHWHHANQREAFDKNFAALLPAVDVLFGTVHLPGATSPQRYGTPEPVPRSIVDQVFYPFRRSVKRLKPPESLSADGAEI